MAGTNICLMCAEPSAFCSCKEGPITDKDEFYQWLKNKVQALRRENRDLMRIIINLKAKNDTKSIRNKRKAV